MISKKKITSIVVLFLAASLFVLLTSCEDAGNDPSDSYSTTDDSTTDDSTTDDSTTDDSTTDDSTTDDSTTDDSDSSTADQIHFSYIEVTFTVLSANTQNPVADAEVVMSVEDDTVIENYPYEATVSGRTDTFGRVTLKINSTSSFTYSDYWDYDDYIADKQISVTVNSSGYYEETGTRSINTQKIAEDDFYSSDAKKITYAAIGSATFYMDN